MSGLDDTVAPMVAGIRPIRIDLPRSGIRFVFTKVLNVGREPLAIRALAMRDRIYRAARGGLQALAFLLGLGLAWWQWRNRAYEARLQQSFFIAIGAALMIGAVTSWLVSMRWLGTAMIVGAPLLALVVMVVLVRMLWIRRRRAGDGEQTSDDSNGSPGGLPSSTDATIPPVVAILVATLFVAGSSGRKRLFPSRQTCRLSRRSTPDGPQHKLVFCWWGGAI